MYLALVITPSLLLFLFGLLIGSNRVTQIQDVRDRKQAIRQEYLNDQLRILKDNQPGYDDHEEFLRWRYKQQAGLVVIDHETNQRHVLGGQSSSPRTRRSAS